MENILEKYAVYTVGSDGKSVLSVVVDSHDEAKKELDKLKSATTCVKINKSRVENFGKEGEKVIESTEVECWKKENDTASGDKLSTFQKAPEAVAPAITDGTGGSNVTGSALPAVTEQVKKTFKEKLEAFYDYFSNHGDLIGLGYGFFPSTVKPESSNGTPSGNIGTDGKPEVVVDEKEEIKKLTEEVAGMKEELSKLVSLEKGEGDNAGSSSGSDGNNSADKSKD